MTRVLSAPQLYRYTGGEPPTHTELVQRYTVQSRGHSADGSEEWLNFIVTLGPDAEPIGYVQATIPAGGEPTLVAWVIGQPWQGRGYAAQAAKLLLKHLAERGIGEVAAHIHPQNQPSNRLAERLGLSPTEITVDGEVRWTGTLASPRIEQT